MFIFTLGNDACYLREVVGKDPNSSHIRAEDHGRWSWELGAES